MIRKHRSPRSKRFVVIATVGLTLLVGILARNFMGRESGVQRQIPRLYSVHDSAFDRAMGLALGPSIVGGNQVVALQDGDEIFPAMLQAIRGAQNSITLETYIYWGGEIGEQFAVALSQRARAGVKVHVLIDWAGSSKMDESLVGMMEQAGVAFRRYSAAANACLFVSTSTTHVSPRARGVMRRSFSQINASDASSLLTVLASPLEPFFFGVSTTSTSANPSRSCFTAAAECDSKFQESCSVPGTSHSSSLLRSPSAALASSSTAGAHRQETNFESTAMRCGAFV